MTDLGCGFRLSLSDMYSTTITSSLSLASTAEKEESTNSRDSVCLRKLKCHTHDNHRFPGTTGNPMNTTQCKHRRQQRTASQSNRPGLELDSKHAHASEETLNECLCGGLGTQKCTFREQRDEHEIPHVLLLCIIIIIISCHVVVLLLFQSLHKTQLLHIIT